MSCLTFLAATVSTYKKPVSKMEMLKLSYEFNKRREMIYIVYQRDIFRDHQLQVLSKGPTVSSIKNY